MKKIKIKGGSIVDILELHHYTSYKRYGGEITTSMVLGKLFEIMLNKGMLSAINIEELFGMEPGQIEIVEDIDEPDPIRKNKTR